MKLVQPVTLLLLFDLEFWCCCWFDPIVQKYKEAKSNFCPVPQKPLSDWICLDRQQLASGKKLERCACCITQDSECWGKLSWAGNL